MSDERATGKIDRALISVSDKTGLVGLGKRLHALGVEIVASGGTAAALARAEVPVIKVSEFTGAQEVLGGRVKTLHPRVHAGILADRRNPDHNRELDEHGYKAIDLVVCNLYPFETVIGAGGEHSEVIENIDIGGPTLLRAAAKNADGGVTALSSPSDYGELLTILECQSLVGRSHRRRFATAAFRHVANYDLAIASYMESCGDEQRSDIDGATGGRDVDCDEDRATQKMTCLPRDLRGFSMKRELRYGENPHQRAALYINTKRPGGGVAAGRLLHGKPLSYNNFLDMDSAFRAVMGVGDRGCAIVKHTNPCGLARGATQAAAFEAALEGDPVSAFGSVLGFNTELSGATAQAIRETKLFVECIVAPSFSPESLEAFGKRPNLRLFEVDVSDWAPTWMGHRIGGGMLVQEFDPGPTDSSSWTCVTERQPDEGWLDELAFAMHTVAQLKSNAIAVTSGLALAGGGAGQMSRVDSVRMAIEKAGEKSVGGFLASDAFFPFDDSVKLAAAAGIAAIVQPGGSKRDEEVIHRCNTTGLCMVFTEQRHFKH